MGRVCMGRDLVAELVMGRVCYGPSLSWAEFVMGRDVPESYQPTVMPVVKEQSAWYCRKIIEMSDIC